MYRTVINQLVEWKNSDERKPLILLGARQVGKTYSLLDFGKQHYKHVAYINCDDNDQVAGLFVQNFDMERVLLAIAAITGVPVVPGETLIILDEIQELPKGLASLKYFCENAPEYHVCVAGSLLGITLRHGESFPVGKVNIIRMFPMTFEEFLIARGKDVMAEQLHKKDWYVLTSLHLTLVQMLREYYLVGGMPEVVKAYLKTNDPKTVRKIQNNILLAYRNDIAKHTTDEESKRIAMVWNSMPSQLSKENKKFVYGVAKKGGRAKEFEVAIQWLIDAGLIIKVGRVSNPAMPLKIYEDLSAFKLYLLDVGLLGAMAEIDPAVLILPNDMKEGKGMFTENFVCTHLAASIERSIFYYSKENSPLEIDFIIQDSSMIVPIEVKSEENLKSKSLSVFLQQHDDMHGIRFSMSPYREQERMTNVPLYATGGYFASF
ncbi:MAG: ATP-binding protein [Bacteroidales bacterium]|nr:ATP-binding protein [Bacteroidales bacterium]